MQQFAKSEETTKQITKERRCGLCPKLADRYVVPPFSVLQCNMGYWQKRKKEWLALGIHSEVGRNTELAYRYMPNAQQQSAVFKNGTSMFDPVLCEVIYTWFCPVGGKVLDPFCGGSVRGIVAHKMGLDYSGFDIREEQIRANVENAQQIGVMPTWFCDDAVNMGRYFYEKEFDLVFTCPPYVGLEKYSDLENDLSNMPYEQFTETYKQIIKTAAGKLKENRFFVLVVGEVRNSRGEYYNLVGDTITHCKAAGLSYYNEIILNTAIGTAAYRANIPMEYGRKVAKVHQNVLVFYKGDIRKIKQHFEPVENMKTQL